MVFSGVAPRTQEQFKEKEESESDEGRRANGSDGGEFERKRTRRAREKKKREREKRKRDEEEFADKREHFVPDTRTFRSTAVNFGIVVGIISLTLSPEAGGEGRE